MNNKRKLSYRRVQILSPLYRGNFWGSGEEPLHDATEAYGAEYCGRGGQRRRGLFEAPPQGNPRISESHADALAALCEQIRLSW
jgi:hypothetical protein